MLVDFETLRLVDGDVEPMRFGMVRSFRAVLRDTEPSIVDVAIDAEYNGKRGDLIVTMDLYDVQDLSLFSRLGPSIAQLGEIFFRDIARDGLERAKVRIEDVDGSVLGHCSAVAIARVVRA